MRFGSAPLGVAVGVAVGVEVGVEVASRGHVAFVSGHDAVGPTIMPYVKPEYRAALDPAIRDLSTRIVDLARAMPEETAFAGLLNYACTSLATQVIHARFERLRYGTIATVTGVFKNIADEFYRRMGVPYEDEQISKNGDVPLYEAQTKKR